VQYTKDQLKSAGFHEVSEVDRWNIKGGEGYYFTRNESTIIAFVVGKKVPQEGIDLFKIAGCHTDSPVLKVAPISKKPNQYGFDMVNIMTYGGGLWRTWFDRDLTLAGKIVIKDSESGRLSTRLWHAKDSLLKVSSLCIHLDR
jgi:aspartyl aminopeptidase